MSTFTEQRGDTLTTDVKQPAAPGHGRDAPRASRLLVTLVAVLAAAVVALGAWVVIDQTSTSDTAVTGEIQQLLDDYHAAWNDADGDAYLSLVTDNAVFRIGTDSTPADEQAGYIDNLDAVSWHVEQIGDAIMTGDGPWYVAVANHLTADTYPVEGYDGVSTVTIVDVNGTLRIANHTYLGQG